IGPGTVARVAGRIGPGGRVVATDISRPMLDVANSKPSLPDAAPIIYIESSAAPLGVESAAFDFVVCQQGLQFFPDLLAALRERRRALKPGGTPGGSTAGSRKRPRRPRARTAAAWRT